MIKRSILAAALGAALVAPLGADGWQGPNAGGDHGHARAVAPTRTGGSLSRRPSAAARTFRPSKPMTLNLGRPASGSHGWNFPARRPGPAPTRPAWGRVGGSWAALKAGQPGRGPWSRKPASGGFSGSNRSFAHGAPSTWGAPAYGWGPRPAPGALPGAAHGMRVAFVQHRHPYSGVYVASKLRAIGVRHRPQIITNRAQLLHTDRQHSMLALPRTGPRGARLHGRLIGPRGSDAGLVRSRMNQLDHGSWRADVNRFNAGENTPGHYYWHHDHGVNFCHYVDPYGYQWYGFYQGGDCFWARNYDNRWWWYDNAQSRWLYYNNNFWWWQDPNHVGDLYCYDNGAYVPAVSQDDAMVVSQPDSPGYGPGPGQDVQTFTSPDGSRVIKLVAGGDDAFLYDTNDPPSFAPMYLASGVQNVQFSDPNNGRPMEILLNLDDGSYDLYDAYGRPYDPGAFDQDAQSYQGNGPDNGPGYSQGNGPGPGPGSGPGYFQGPGPGYGPGNGPGNGPGYGGSNP